MCLLNFCFYEGIIGIIFVLLTRKSDKIYETDRLHSIASTGLWSWEKQTQIRCLHLIPRDTFQTTAQGRGTQKRADILPELRRQSYEFTESRKARICSTGCKEETATRRECQRPVGPWDFKWVLAYIHLWGSYQGHRKNLWKRVSWAIPGAHTEERISHVPISQSEDIRKSLR